MEKIKEIQKDVGEVKEALDDISNKEGKRFKGETSNQHSFTGNKRESDENEVYDTEERDDEDLYDDLERYANAVSGRKENGKKDENAANRRRRKGDSKRN